MTLKSEYRRRTYYRTNKLINSAGVHPAGHFREFCRWCGSGAHISEECPERPFVPSLTSAQEAEIADYELKALAFHYYSALRALNDGQLLPEQLELNVLPKRFDTIGDESMGYPTTDIVMLSGNEVIATMSIVGASLAEWQEAVRAVQMLFPAVDQIKVYAPNGERVALIVMPDGTTEDL